MLSSLLSLAWINRMHSATCYEISACLGGNVVLGERIWMIDGYMSMSSVQNLVLIDCECNRPCQFKNVF